MDLGDPTRSVTGALDGPILAVLAAAGHPLPVREIAAQSARGSEIGIRKSLARLTEQGIVRTTEIGRNRVHELNRKHVAADIAISLGGLRTTLWNRFRDRLRKWRPTPVYACIFGSAARGDGDTESDIDLLLVRIPKPGERDSRLRASATGARMAGFLTQALTEQMTRTEIDRWEKNVDSLREDAFEWTGNHLGVLELSLFEWLRQARSETAVWREIQRDGIELFRRR